MADTSTMPIEHPVLFSAPMVRAILDGTKTQTRRVVTPIPPVECLLYAGVTVESSCRADEGKHLFADALPLMTKAHRVRNPYGVPGDRLWVRETWAQVVGEDMPDGTPNIVYAAHAFNSSSRMAGIDRRESPREVSRWHPSIFMPRWASRITLEIAEVRVQRLQDISAEDSLAEGIPRASVCGCEVCRHSAQMCPADAGEQILAFRDAWDHINGDRKRCDWESNPWVWALRFKRIKP